MKKKGDLSKHRLRATQLIYAETILKCKFFKEKSGFFKNGNPLYIFRYNQPSLGTRACH
jgi:hypothetical protein